ncbi:MAG: FAD:protein FMN transferase [Microbacteriaceae bacterium]|nr:FAD:protein FMN transferase [Microbacteriaceae bacterium]
MSSQTTRAPRIPYLTMPDDGTARAAWSDWSVSVMIAVTDPDALHHGIDLTMRRMDDVAGACSRFDENSELMRAARADDEDSTVSSLCASLVHDALCVASDTQGKVTPVMGEQLSACGYRMDLSQIRVDDPGVFEVHPAASWKQIQIEGNHLRQPHGIVLDLGATAKAGTADWIARRIVDDTDSGAYVELGGDIATAGSEPDGGWRVLVRDLPGEPEDRISLHGRGGLATSSTLRRRWRVGKRVAHHILDPRTGLPATEIWRTVSVAAPSCLAANAAATAAIVSGSGAAYDEHLRHPSRFVAQSGEVLRLGGWPHPAEVTA